MEKSKTALLESSVLAIGAGVAGSVMFPAYAAYGGVMVLSGVVGLFSFASSYSKFDRLWESMGFERGFSAPRLKSKTVKDGNSFYCFTLPPGMCLDDFLKKQQAIEQYLGNSVSIKYTYKEIQIEVIEKDPKTIYEYNPVRCNGELGIPIGYDQKGKLVTCDLSRGEPHLLIAGETGSGKSTALRSIITNLLVTTPAKLHLVDLKHGAEFQIFSRCKNVVSFAKSEHDALQLLKEILSSVEQRYDAFYADDCIDVNEYNRKHKDKAFGREVVIVDEFAELSPSKEAIRTLETVAAQSRAAGIHLILSTQRPDAQVLNGRIKANVTGIVGLKCTNDVNSRIVIDESGLEKLRGNGDCLFKRGGLTRVQCPNLTAERAREIVRPLYAQDITQASDTHDAKVTQIKVEKKTPEVLEGWLHDNR